MLIKEGIKLFRYFPKSYFLRLSRGLQQKPSYLYNAGSEPLSLITLGDCIANTCHRYPGTVAVRSIYEDIELTYEELLNKADSLGYALRENGLEKGDRVGIWSHNNAEWIVALVAAARVGLVSVLLNPVYEKPELSYCIKKANLKGLVIGECLKNRNYYEMLCQMILDLNKSKEGALKSKDYPELTTIITCGKENLAGAFSVESLVKSYSNRDVAKYGGEIGHDDGCIIHFTSGTTSNPKAAIDSHLGLVNNANFTGKRNLLHEGHQTVCVQVPLFHALGSIITTLASLRHGSTLVLASPMYNVTSNINALLAEKCTVVTGTPTMYVDMLSQLRGKPDLPFTLKVALAGGAPCSPEIIRQMKRQLGTKSVKALYGLTETTAGVFQSVEGDGVEKVAETVGYIHDHVEVKVVNEKKETVPFGSPGELMVRGYLNMIGYWNDEEKTKQTIDQDGWLATGDRFTISEDGYGTVVGRLKDIIVRGGENIAPKEIEDFLNAHPDVIESQVVGVADDRLGEELCAVLRIREGKSFALEDMRKYCDSHLSRFKIPRIVKTIDQFPKTTSGKIQKYKLKELIESGNL